MSNEILIKTQVTIDNGLTTLTIPGTTRKADMAGSRIFRDAPAIPTTAGGTLIDLGSLTTYGFANLINLDDTNFVEIGVQVSGTFYPLIKLLPGQETQTWLGTSSLYALADTAAVILDVQVAER